MRFTISIPPEMILSVSYSVTVDSSCYRMSTVIQNIGCYLHPVIFCSRFLVEGLYIVDVKVVRQFFLSAIKFFKYRLLKPYIIDIELIAKLVE